MKVNYIPIRLCIGLLLLLQQCTQRTITLSPSTGDWMLKAELEGPARRSAASFTIGPVAYIGTGLDASNNPLTDFWKYDPARNAWTQVASFPAKCRSEAIGSKGYVTTGTNDNKRFDDLWAFDPAN